MGLDRPSTTLSALSTPAPAPNLQIWSLCSWLAGDQFFGSLWRQAERSCRIRKARRTGNGEQGGGELAGPAIIHRLRHLHLHRLTHQTPKLPAHTPGDHVRHPSHVVTHCALAFHSLGRLQLCYRRSWSRVTLAQHGVYGGSALNRCTKYSTTGCVGIAARKSAGSIIIEPSRDENTSSIVRSCA